MPRPYRRHECRPTLQASIYANKGCIPTPHRRHECRPTDLTYSIKPGIPASLDAIQFVSRKVIVDFPVVFKVARNVPLTLIRG